MIYYLRVLLNPKTWLTVGNYDGKWNYELLELMENHKFKKRGQFTVKLGDREIWISNHPYASFSIYEYNPETFKVVRGGIPRRATMQKAWDKLNEECPYEN